MKPIITNPISRNVPSSLSMLMSVSDLRVRNFALDDRNDDVPSDTFIDTKLDESREHLVIDLGAVLGIGLTLGSLGC